MIVGGLQKNSFIDYPGKISCVLFLSGCNFSCPYCHNPLLAKGCLECPAFLKDNGFYEFLEKRKGLLEGVVISGGEPTLQKDLATLCGNIKKMGYPVKIDTNGSRPKVIEELIQKELVDYIAMDIKTEPLSYSPVLTTDCLPEQIISSIKIIMDSGIPYEFKTTCIKPLINEEIVERICRYIEGAMLYAIQQFQENTEVLHPEVFRGNAYRFGPEELRRLKAVADPFVEQCIIR